MQKRLLVLAMAVAVAMGAVAQDRTQKERDAVNTRGEQFFKAIDEAFAKHSKKKGPNWYNVGNNGQQFIVDNLAKFGVKKSSIKGQFDVLESDSKVNLSLDRYFMGMTQDPSTVAGLSYYTSTYEVKSTVTKEGTQSVVRNSIAIQWRVNWKKFYDEKKDAWKKGAFRTDNKIKKTAVDIVSIKTVEVPVLTVEKQQMARLVNAEIQKWYADVNNNFNYQKANINKSKSITPLAKVDASKVNVSESMISEGHQIITVGSMPKIAVKAANPNEFIPEQEQGLYTNPECGWDVYPTFKVAVDADAQTARIEDVTYYTKTVKPSSDPEKARRLAAARQTASDFVNKLSAYASADKKDKNLRNELEGMFVDKNAKCIQFTLIDKKGNENQKYVEKPTTPKSYIAHLPKAEFEMTPRAAFLEDGGNTAVIRLDQNYTQLYPQNYKGQKYADRTIKAFTMKYDDQSGKWLIDKIDAQVGTTYLRDTEAE